MYVALADIFNTAAVDERTRVVLWHGAGDSFCAGNDVEDFLKSPPGPGDSSQARLMDALINFDKPLVAAVQGAAIGGGTTMLTHCDFVYAGESAKFQMPFINLAVVPEFGSSCSVPARIGHIRAAELILLGLPFDARRAVELGFSSTVGIIHDGDGQLQPLGTQEREVYRQMKAMEKGSYARINFFQDNIADGRPNEWRCRAGARYLYVCEDGLVHYCSQQRGYPAKPLMEYTVDDIRHEFLTEKSCAPHCTVSCVHQVAYIDRWRAPQRPSTPQAIPEPGGLVQIE